MAKIFGQLEKAQLENTTADVANQPKGMVTYRTDINQAKISNGAVSKVVIDEDSTQTLSGKTLATPIVNILSGTVQGVTPSTPPAGTLLLYAKNGGFFQLDSLGVESGLTAVSGFSTGDVKFTLKTVADTNWVMANDGTIGNAASSGTARANADTLALFTLLWNNVSNTYAAVSGGRGASAAADFAANKTIALTKMLGRALGVAGAGSTLTSRALGEFLGAETHVLSTAEMPAHTHIQDPHIHYVTQIASINTNGSAVPGSGNLGTLNTGPTTATNQSTGGNGSHNNMQPTSFLNVMIKL